MSIESAVLENIELSKIYKENTFEEVYIRGFKNIMKPIDESSNNRRTGKTTRIIDKIIQLLFNNPNRFICYTERNKQETEYLLDKLMNRLCNEHNGKDLIKKKL